MSGGLRRAIPLASSGTYWLGLTRRHMKLNGTGGQPCHLQRDLNTSEMYPEGLSDLRSVRALGDPLSRCCMHRSDETFGPFFRFGVV